MTNKLQRSQINKVLYEIHRDISAPLSARKLAQIAAYSEQHFHRVFKEVVGETVNIYIRRTRLEHAASQLMFDHTSSVLSIAEKCGFISLSSFNKAFKTQFGITPGNWRQIDRHKSDLPYLADAEINAGYQRIKDRPLPKPKILLLPPQHVAYLRHQGYGRAIGNTWALLHAWAREEAIHCDYSPLDGVSLKGQQIGLYHSNPAWVKLDDCRYVACITIDTPITHRGVVNSLTIPGGLHAAFDLQGTYGELLPWIGKILALWLPGSGYKLQTTPAFVHYRKNQFLSSDDAFDVRLFLPIFTV